MALVWSIFITLCTLSINAQQDLLTATERTSTTTTTVQGSDLVDAYIEERRRDMSFLWIGLTAVAYVMVIGCVYLVTTLKRKYEETQVDAATLQASVKESVTLVTINQGNATATNPATNKPEMATIEIQKLKGPNNEQNKPENEPPKYQWETINIEEMHGR